jgi:hypothetical protein
MKGGKDRDVTAWVDCFLDMCMDGHKWVERNNKMVTVT